MDVRELLTEPGALRSAVRDEALHDDQAWDVGLDIDGFLRRVVAELGRLPTLVVEHSDFGHYGSGYASFVEVSMTKRDGSLRHDGGHGWVEVECLGILLCRLAPIACALRPSVRSTGTERGFHSLPSVDRAVTAVDQQWTYGFQQIRTVLDKHGLTLVGTDVLTLPLPGRLFVNTNLADSAFTIFDAWFHWMD